MWYSNWRQVSDLFAISLSEIESAQDVKDKIGERLIEL